MGVCSKNDCVFGPAGGRAHTGAGRKTCALCQPAEMLGGLSPSAKAALIRTIRRLHANGRHEDVELAYQRLQVVDGLAEYVR